MSQQAHPITPISSPVTAQWFQETINLYYNTFLSSKCFAEFQNAYDENNLLVSLYFQNGQSADEIKAMIPDGYLASMNYQDNILVVNLQFNYTYSGDSESKDVSPITFPVGNSWFTGNISNYKAAFMNSECYKAFLAQNTNFVTVNLYFDNGQTPDEIQAMVPVQDFISVQYYNDTKIVLLTLCPVKYNYEVMTKDLETKSMVTTADN